MSKPTAKHFISFNNKFKYLNAKTYRNLNETNEKIFITC